MAVTLRNPRILGVTVAGQSVAPEKAPAAPGDGAEDKTYFINVARTADSDEPFQIAMVFETPRPEKELKLAGRLSVPLPRFDEGVKFQQVYVRVWAPKDYRLVGDPDGFISHIGVGLWDSRQITEAADNPDGWFPKDSSSFDFQVGGTTYLFSSLTEPRGTERRLLAHPHDDHDREPCCPGDWRRAAAVFVGNQGVDGARADIHGRVPGPVCAVACE